MLVYRIYTEKKNEDEVFRIVSKYFSGYTVFYGTGFWNGNKEDSVIIEIIESGYLKIGKQVILASEEIKAFNMQESVLVTITEIQDALFI